MSKLQALATLVGMSKEYEEEILYLQQALLKITQAKRRIHYTCKGWYINARDPDADFCKKYPNQVAAIFLLEETEDLIKKFTEGILKYE